MKLEIRNLTFAYEKNKTVFDGLSVSVEAGQVLCLLGPNGAGKTTLLKAILGLLKPRQGDIFLNDRNIVNWSRKKLAQSMGYVPQNHIPPFPFKVIDVVLMGRTSHIGSYSSPREMDWEIACGALETLNILELQHRNYTELSGGERQLVLIARALAQKPQFLILDEPTANLDFGNQVRVLSLIRKLADQGYGVIMSSHFPDDAFQYSMQAALLKDGHICAAGNAEEVVNEDNLRKIYGVDVKIAKAYSEDGEGHRVCIPVVA